MGRGITLLFCVPSIVPLNLEPFAIALNRIIKITRKFCVEKLQKAEKVIP